MFCDRCGQPLEGNAGRSVELAEDDERDTVALHHTCIDEIVRWWVRLALPDEDSQEPMAKELAIFLTHRKIR